MATRAPARTRTAPRRRPAARWKPLPAPVQREASYRRSLRAVVEATWTEAQMELAPLLARLERAQEREERREDALPSVAAIRAALGRAAARILRLFPSRRLQALAEQVATATQAEHRRALRRQFSEALGINVLAEEPSLRPTVQAFTRRNVALIRSLPTELLGQVEKQLVEALEKGTRAEAISKQLQERYQVARSRADLIARDQVGKLTASLTETRHKALGITKYRWRTMKDNRVRESHRRREGKVFSYDDPPNEDPIDGHPGTPIGDRCWPEPIIEDFERLK